MIIADTFLSNFQNKPALSAREFEDGRSTHSNYATSTSKKDKERFLESSMNLECLSSI
jgi:hypothetical protein